MGRNACLSEKYDKVVSFGNVYRIMELLNAECIYSVFEIKI